MSAWPKQWYEFKEYKLYLILRVWLRKNTDTERLQYTYIVLYRYNLFDEGEAWNPKKFNLQTKNSSIEKGVLSDRTDDTPVLNRLGLFF